MRCDEQRGVCAMSYYTPQTSVLDLGDGNTVTVRKRAYGDEQNAIAANTKIDPMHNTGNVDAAGMAKALLLAGIVSWDGPGFEGRPVSLANLEALPVAVAERISEAVAAINESQSAGEKKQSRRSTTR